jgi:hypothetical protein
MGGDADEGRRDPVIAGGKDEGDSGDSDETVPGLDSGEPRKRRVQPDLPDEVDALIDCCIRIEAMDSVEVTKLWAAQKKTLGGLSRPLAWYAFDDGDNHWRRIDAHSSGAYHWFLAALQLVDRTGAIGERDFLHFTDGVQRLAEKFQAVPAELPARTKVLIGAMDLDRFCAEVDVQIAINLVPAPGQTFAGTQIRALAEAAGMALDGDGSFHACNANGLTLYTLVNGGDELFTREKLGDLLLTKLSFMLDLPRVPQGAEEFERMIQFANSMAAKLNATVVDDKGKPFGTEAVAFIRQNIQLYQDSMTAQGIPAGSPLALRLFEA